MTGLNPPFAAQGCGVLESVVELAHIARPVVAYETGQGFVRELGYGAVRSAGNPGQEMAGDVEAGQCGTC